MVFRYSLLGIFIIFFIFFCISYMIFCTLCKRNFNNKTECFHIFDYHYS